MPAASDSVPESSPMPSAVAGTIPFFVVGHDYIRQRDIHRKYGGSWQNGISSSALCPAIFVFTGESGEQYGYRDGFDDAGVFSYSGEGQTGNMVFKAGNRSLRDHAKDGRAVYLFEALGKGKPCRYLGEFVVANHAIASGPDRDGADRDIIVFHMMRVDSIQDAPASGYEASVVQVATSLNGARARALAACFGPAGPAGTAAVKTLYQRSRAVRDYVLMRAGGSCEGCGSTAPFLGIDGQPYLEAHHTTRLSDGGLDHPRFVAALCPTCHRRVHYGQDGKNVNKRLSEWLAVNEPIT